MLLLNFLHLMLCCCFIFILVFFFKQKTAYEMRISDWSSDVCSSDLMMASTEQAFAELTNGAYQKLLTQPDGSSEILLAVDTSGTPKQIGDMRSEERRVGKECVRTCRSRL